MLKCIDVEREKINEFYREIDKFPGKLNNPYDLSVFLSEKEDSKVEAWQKALVELHDLCFDLGAADWM
ncbi:hypothetical protein IQ259_25435 [Fortiea sp. LEGE XX443]|uniref:hypothetical protein n=1 Tax=Fortiea sp. LEGE XX443 TaxID=1828611 RepID=UPI00187E2BE4|nr:hypothetical protein [Fortiea sp. LEGE XX443]MBE9008310.1 hypothetical protein [Fortiea sp. LEGE XX443]